MWLVYIYVFKKIIRQFLKNFVKIENKWNEINSGYKCCDNNLYTNKPTGNY